MKPGMILVLVGVALIVCALMDVFKMSQGINLDLGRGETLAQATAERVAFRQRQAVLRADLWLEESLAFTGGSTP
ncbi:MAG TPA: hypothetical protein PLF37_12900 [Planctomycetota bacterium]|nr:hypothetical protein [Planctomycetota bacterium]